MSDRDEHNLVDLCDQYEQDLVDICSALCRDMAVKKLSDFGLGDVVDDLDRVAEILRDYDLPPDVRAALRCLEWLEEIDEANRHDGIKSDLFRFGLEGGITLACSMEEMQLDELKKAAFSERQRSNRLGKRSPRKTVAKTALTCLDEEVISEKAFERYVGDGITVIACRIEVTPLRDDSRKIFKYRFLELHSGRTQTLSPQSLGNIKTKIRRERRSKLTGFRRNSHT